jgi:LysW-gamma-L-alpha-aminoadipyl-6-phosphate/LysW-L-glutamyl-5-phosphate reductase
VADVKIGSSAAGMEATIGSIHAERSGTIRLYAPTTHRHVAEVQQELAAVMPGGANAPATRVGRNTPGTAVGPTNGAVPAIHYSAHAVELVRGLMATCHVFLARSDVTEKDVWKAYRAAYQDEPFIRFVKERSGLHRFPDPKLVAGSNFADIGFELEEGTNRLVAVCAIDNLVKGAAGSAVQCMNLMLGLPETTGLTQLPLHPV